MDWFIAGIFEIKLYMETFKFVNRVVREGIPSLIFLYNNPIYIELKFRLILLNRHISININPFLLIMKWLIISAIIRGGFSFQLVT